MPPVFQLPDELLLKVLQQLPGLPRARQRDILNTSLTSKRLRPIAIEVLLVHPVIHLSRVAQLAHLYFRNPNLIPRVRTVELMSATVKTNPDFVTKNMRLIDGMEYLDREYQQFWGHLIDGCTTTASSRAHWARDLENFDCAAYLGLLLAMLPNMSELLLGPNFLHYYPILNPLICDPESERNGILSPTRSSTPYLDDVFDVLRRKLVALEFPVSSYVTSKVYNPVTRMSRVWNIHSHLGPMSHLRFAQLRSLTIPCFMLGQYRAILPRWRIHTMLPETLEVLRVVDAFHLPIRCFLRAILEWPKTSPALKRVEVYFHNHPYDADCVKRERGLHTHARNLGVELYIRHPHPPVLSPRGIFKPIAPIFDAMDANGQPWRYTEEELLQLEEQAWRRRYGE
ncbi:hypothetical protein K505DRAFT_399473 [Melanomma pulvis-pyrius CBS 109.77]|uniref:F-box domain-containing protein n=1 Tax=Melanomma pulvis-pyrius CBS 109.77 TaxID=1314802 RepID=A0A6A6WQ99_9PLEO|nr:hypothetical protein K505DRAFT_399473 [Melanomma pulvis-pyrius CBS 109.77]